MTSELIVPQLHRDSQHLTGAIARRALDEAQRTETVLLREHRRYRLDSAVVADATGRARVRHSMATDPTTTELARVARDAHGQLVVLRAARMSAFPARAMIARTEHAHLIEQLEWLHPALVGLTEREGALTVVGDGPSPDAAGLLVESIARRRAALAHLRGVLARHPARAWALAEVVEAELDRISLSPAARYAALEAARQAARTAEGVALVRAWTVAGATAR